MKLYFIAGEHSGDFIGGKVIVALMSRNDVIIHGIGGPKMIAAGMRQSLFDFQQINLMGFVEILPHIFRLKELINQTVEDIIQQNPDVLVTIDSPGFTFRVAKMVKARAPHIKLVHIVAPSVWAYKPGRAKKYASVYDKLLTLLPFEPPYFTVHGLNSVCIGHPVLETCDIIQKPRHSGIRRASAQALSARALYPESQETGVMHVVSHEIATASSRPRNDGMSAHGIATASWRPRNDVVGHARPRNDGSYTIAITPGSRKGEIKRHMKIIKDALEILAQKHKIKAIFIQPNERYISYIQEFLEDAAAPVIPAKAGIHSSSSRGMTSGNSSFDFSFSTDRLESFAKADVALAKSGTNTLEISACGTPMIVGYKLNALTYILLKMVIKVKYASIVNIIAGKEIIPEYIQWNFTAENIAAGLDELLVNKNKARAQVQEAQNVLTSLGFGAEEKPSERAAREIMGVV